MMPPSQPDSESDSDGTEEVTIVFDQPENPGQGMLHLRWAVEEWPHEATEQPEKYI